MTHKSLRSYIISAADFCARKLWFDHHYPNEATSLDGANVAKLPWDANTVDLRNPMLQLDETVNVMFLPNGACMPILATTNLRTKNEEISPHFHTRLEFQAAALRLQGHRVETAAFFDTHTGEIVERPCDPTDMDHGLGVWQKLLALLADEEPPSRLRADPKCVDCDRLEICVQSTLPAFVPSPSKEEALRSMDRLPSPQPTPRPETSQPQVNDHESEKNIVQKPHMDDSDETRSSTIRGATSSAEPSILPTEPIQPATHNVDEEQEPAGQLRTVPPRQDTLPVYVDTPGAIIKLKNKEIFVWSAQGTQLLRRGLHTVSNLNLYGGVHITTPALTRLIKEDIPVCFFTAQGWYRGRTQGSSDTGIHRRIAQFRAFEGAKAIEVARQLVTDKIFNQRVFLRRHNDSGLHDAALKEMKRMIALADRTSSMDSLRGFEGNAAKVYWDAFARMIHVKNPEFMMDGRNRRPPRDAPNAMLSYMYGMLVRSCTLEIENTGLDAHLGMYHQPHVNRPSLALDLMEPFRPILVDSSVYNLISRHGIRGEDFINNGGGVTMKKTGRTAIIRAFESRMDTEVKHPIFGYTLSYRRMLHSHAQLLGQYFEGELDAPPSYRTR